MNKLLEQRNRIKKKKPAFVVKDSQVTVRVKSRWRKPRGKQSPVRQQHKGRIRLVRPGYGSPKAVKHLHSTGLEKVLVQNKDGLKDIDIEKQGIVISSLVGNRKRIELIKAALDKKITILNFKDAEKHLTQLKEAFDTRKQSKKKKLTEKEKKDVEKKKKAEEKESKEEKKDESPEEDKDKKAVEKKEAEKAIIKKQ